MDVSSIADALLVNNAGKSDVNAPPDIKFDLGTELEINRLRAENEELFAAFENDLKKILDANEIDLSEEIAVKLDFEGNIIVFGDHPDSEKIADILNQYAGFKEYLLKINENSTKINELTTGQKQIINSNQATNQATEELLFGGLDAKKARPILQSLFNDVVINTLFEMLENQHARHEAYKGKDITPEKNPLALDSIDHPFSDMVETLSAFPEFEELAASIDELAGKQLSLGELASLKDDFDALIREAIRKEKDLL